MWRSDTPFPLALLLYFLYGIVYTWMNKTTHRPPLPYCTVVFPFSCWSWSAMMNRKFNLFTTWQHRKRGGGGGGGRDENSQKSSLKSFAACQVSLTNFLHIFRVFLYIQYKFCINYSCWTLTDWLIDNWHLQTSWPAAGSTRRSITPLTLKIIFFFLFSILLVHNNRSSRA